MPRITKAVKNYQAALKRLFNTPDGYIVLATWREDNVNKSSLVPMDPCATAYYLGRKELVQEVINHLKDDGVLDDIKIETEY